ncbi:MAG: hypothetical protein L6R38_009157 [Xanthoria sp. 2 TBL-2021]|nr:MAG: hypothetical protein L6R38_009157 [Xanthoria sp. 2 TBL-2021]
MVFGLLALTAIPTTIGVAESISATKKKDDDNEEQDPTVASTTEAQRMRKFRLQCYCDAPSSKAKEIDGGTVILRDDKLWVQPSSSPPSSAAFLGFYVPYPDPSRHPPPLGLVSFTPTTPPTLNWIYASNSTRELLYGNRTASIEHTVGPWAWDLGEDEGADDSHAGDNGGGLTLRGNEGAIAVETDGGWQLFWEDAKGEIPNPDDKKRRKMQVSIERVFAEDAQDAGAGVMEEKKQGEKKESKGGVVKGGVEVRDETGEKKEDRRTETTLEVRTKKVTADEKDGKGKKKEEKTKYEYRA